MNSMDYADDLIRELQARWGLPLRRLPKYLGGALASARLSSKKLPPNWSESEPRLGYLALYQRILAGTLPADSTAAQSYGEPLRLALSAALDREIVELRFRHSAAGAQSGAAAPPASSLLADLLDSRLTEGSLSSKVYTVVLGDLRLGGDLPPVAGVAPSQFWSEMEPGEIQRFEADDPAAAHLTFARFARLIASGLVQGMQVRILLDPGLRSDSNSQSDQTGLDEEIRTAEFRLGVLIALRDLFYDGRPLLKLSTDPLMDAAAYAHLKAADAALRKDPVAARSALGKRDLAALSIAQAKFAVRQLVLPAKVRAAGAARLLSLLPSLRLLLEASSAHSRRADIPRAFLWLRLHESTTKGDPERLMRLDDETSRTLASNVEEMWSRSAASGGPGS